MKNSNTHIGLIKSMITVVIFITLLLLSKTTYPRPAGHARVMKTSHPPFPLFSEGGAGGLEGMN